jgi:hypothetical protein
VPHESEDENGNMVITGHKEFKPNWIIDMSVYKGQPIEEEDCKHVENMTYLAKDLNSK